MKNKILLLFIILILPSLVYAESIEVNPLLLKTTTQMSVAAEDFINVKNLEPNTVLVKITTKNPSFKLSNYGFGLLPDEEKELRFVFSSKVAGVFTNNFFIRSENTTKVLPVIIEVESSNVRFDSTIETLDAKRTFYSGEELAFSFTIFDLLEYIDTDVNMEYSIIDMADNEVYNDENVVNVKIQKTLTKKVQLPDSLNPGIYVLIISSRQGSSIGYSTLLFNIIEKPIVLEKFNLKNFCYGLVNSCLNDGICKGITLSVALILLALLSIYIIGVIKLSNLPKKKIERALKNKENVEKKLSLTKKVLKESEEQKITEEQEKIEEINRKKIIDEMLSKQRKRKPTISEKKLLEREIQKGIKERKKLKK